MMKSLIHAFIITIVYLHITCLFTIQQKENNKEELNKNEVFKCMISKLVKYNLNKKLQIYLVGQPWALSSRNISFATSVFYQ